MADSNEKRPWLVLTKVAGPEEQLDVSGTTLINLDLVCRAVITNITEIRLFYSETHVEVIQGTGATQLMKLLLERSVSIDGEPFVFPATSDEPASA